MGRILNKLSSSLDFSLVSINGGTMDNAITRECSCKIALSSECEALFKHINRLNSALRKEFKPSDPDLTVRIRSCDSVKQCLKNPIPKR